jgi:hypothetical protein
MSILFFFLAESDEYTLTIRSFCKRKMEEASVLTWRVLNTFSVLTKETQQSWNTEQEGILVRRTTT